MSNHDREDALARALDLLPEGDPVRADPRLVRDPALVAEARAARETAADVWLAVSPLRAAPPDALPSILWKIETAASARPAPRWPLVSGWAAAAAIALAWWISPPSEATESTAETAAIAAPTARQEAHPAFSSPRSPATEERSRLRRELAQLRHAIQAKPPGTEPSGWSPRVIVLSAPGATPVDPEDSQNRLMAVLTTALRGVLESDSGGDASLVIERGWLPQGVLELADDEWVRHRSFPRELWSEHGLLMDGDGRFYDPAHHLLWSADPDSTDFIGRSPRADDDLSVFSQEMEHQKSPAAEAQKWVEKAPAGFLIEDPGTGEARLVIEGLLPPPEGSSYVLMGSGGSRPATTLATNIGFLNGDGLASGVISMTDFTAGGATNFSLVQVNGRGVTEAVIITGGN